MKVLIKLGGTLLDAAESRHSLSRQIAAAARQHDVAVVHGGGKQLSRYLEEKGIRSTFRDGLRVTGPEALDAVVKVLAGTVNHELVASLVAAGARAVGLSGIDANIAEAEQMDPELGAVGKVVRSNPELLDLLASNGYLPVVACVGGDRLGCLYNVNADQMAVACAAGFAAGHLLFLTDVAGVMDGNGRICPSLTASQSERLMADGIATGGMLAKLNAANAALRMGVGQVSIAPGSMVNVVERVLAGEAVGTRLVLSEVTAS